MMEASQVTIQANILTCRYLETQTLFEELLAISLQALIQRCLYH